METVTSADTDREVEEATAISSHFLRILEPPATKKPRTRSSEARAQEYRDLMDALGVAVYTTDAVGVITHFNQAAADLWGRRPEIGKDLWCGSWKIYHLDGITIMPHGECPMAICLKENRPVRGVEAIAERPDGSRVFFMPFPTPLRDQSGKLVGAINVLVDVTAGKQAELAAARLAAIVKSSDDAIISKNLDGTVTSWNAGAERIFGYTAEETIGRSIRMIIPPDRQYEEDEVLSRVGMGEYVEHFQTVRRRKNGSLVDISLSVSPIKDSSGKIVGASKIAHDISEQKRAEEALLKSMAVKDEFLGLVSHELRTPITTILGNALLLHRRGDKLPDDTKKQALGDVVNEAERLQRIIENLLLLTRVDVAEHLDSDPLRLHPLIIQAVDAVQRRNPRRTIDVSSDGEVPIVRGQPALLGLVLDNLITNADKYSPIEVPIEIRVYANGQDEVEVCVRDYGIGLDDSEIEQIFTPFYRSQSAKSQAKGIGLGLAVCKRVMEAQDGTIRAIARAEGGCDFIFSIPRYRGDSA
ncbi:MAG TPA: PAS domain S-box protein [Dehalococcoidia bacterium]|jgi:PAS domain S-box-containing protein|nr:PAS domain S-box protein [Dehalococcoidia bacterium]